MRLVAACANPYKSSTQVKFPVFIKSLLRNCLEQWDYCKCVHYRAYLGLQWQRRRTERSVRAEGHWQCHEHTHRRSGKMPTAWLVHQPFYLFPATSDVTGIQHKASWEAIVIVLSVFDMVNGVPPGWEITTHNQTIREKITVCIASFSNVNQLGNSCHCDVMAQHLHGNSEGFSCTFYGFLRCQFLQAQCLR